MKGISQIAISIESISLFVWIVFLLFSLLFLDSPNAKISHLWPIAIPLIITAVILSLNIFIQLPRVFVVIGIVIVLLISAPVLMWINSHISKKINTISDRMSFVLPVGYESIKDYLIKKEGGNVEIVGRVFVSDMGAKLFVNRMSIAEVVVILLPEMSKEINNTDVIVWGVLSKKGSDWYIEKPNVERYEDMVKAREIIEKKVSEKYPLLKRSGHNLTLIDFIKIKDSPYVWYAKFDVLEGYDMSIEIKMNTMTGEVLFYQDNWS